MSTSTSLPEPGQKPISSFLSRHARTRLSLLLAPPLMWLVIVYLVALALLLVTALWQTDSFTGEIQRVWTLEHFKTLFTDPTYVRIGLRTLGIALAVTLIDLILALPIAFFMSKVAGPRLRSVLLICILMPLWASYLVKAFAWRAVLANGGIADNLLGLFGGHSPGYGLTGVILTLSYIWLPYMILPVHTGLERVQGSLLEASADLGGRPGVTWRRVIMPLLVPAMIAGSIFTFSLTLGDYITAGIVGGRTQMLGSVIYANVGAANNLPFAAAVAFMPIIIVLGYLFLVRRTGALDNL